MLRVVYETRPNLRLGQLVDIQESRGEISVKIKQGASVDEHTAALNAALQRFLASPSTDGSWSWPPSAGTRWRPSRSQYADISPGHGVYTVGRGAVGMLLPMKKLVCGGWL